jgi:hypothetical protein
MDLKETGWECGLNSSGLRHGNVVCSWEQSNERLGPIQQGNSSLTERLC